MAETERQVNVSIEAAPDGLHVRVEYTGPLGSIPAAIERLKQSGVLELVSANRAAQHTAPLSKPKGERVTPSYDGDGDPCCPVHKRKLSEGAHGLFCSAKARGEQVADRKGYCGLRFTDE